ncbi:hypothetical protein [Siansivirga zeaxanthinifaciens]|uniref:Uncharacterized protein n=1 Tax=Siansivirga zeaxanthinifaciens CC-SAMT-1 TaxID=1454006 RepID=A0A0C5WEV6_9FLAO|nr:hypothetical protein [Siansivirga zeaxanthinifaciens]AJR04737.1 hypothetical protein AW14_02915 [Siansivirga zeaxanthinifaciens CC-SAMT-1]
MKKLITLIILLVHALSFSQDSNFNLFNNKIKAPKFATVNKEGQGGGWSDLYRNYKGEGINVWSVSNGVICIDKIINKGTNFAYFLSPYPSNDEFVLYSVDVFIPKGATLGNSISIPIGTNEGNFNIAIVSKFIEGWQTIVLKSRLSDYISENAIFKYFRIDHRLNNEGIKLKNPTLLIGGVFQHLNFLSEHVLEKAQEYADSISKHMEAQIELTLEKAQEYTDSLIHLKKSKKIVLFGDSLTNPYALALSTALGNDYTVIQRGI